MSSRWLTADERQIVFETDWKMKFDNAVARLANLERFEQSLFDRLNEPTLPEANRERIEGTDIYDGLLEYVQREIRSLIRSISYYRMNANLTAMRRSFARTAESRAISTLSVSREVRKWIEESSGTVPESA